jgi:hypothetical protein
VKGARDARPHHPRRRTRGVHRRRGGGPPGRHPHRSSAGNGTEAELLGEAIVQIRTFAEAGVLTANRGLVVTLDRGEEFQVTIVRSR